MTLTISAADLATVRRRIGDNASVNNDLSDLVIDAIYTATAQGNLDVDRTTYFAAVERWGIKVNSTGITNQYGGVSRNQLFEQLEKIISYWGGQTGLSGQALAAGKLSLGIDTRYADTHILLTLDTSDHDI